MKIELAKCKAQSKEYFE